MRKEYIAMIVKLSNVPKWDTASLLLYPKIGTTIRNIP